MQDKLLLSETDLNAQRKLRGFKDDLSVINGSIDKVDAIPGAIFDSALNNLLKIESVLKEEEDKKALQKLLALRYRALAELENTNDSSAFDNYIIERNKFLNSVGNFEVAKIADTSHTVASVFTRADNYLQNYFQSKKTGKQQDLNGGFLSKLLTMGGNLTNIIADSLNVPVESPVVVTTGMFATPKAFGQVTAKSIVPEAVEPITIVQQAEVAAEVVPVIEPEAEAAPDVVPVVEPSKNVDANQQQIDDDFELAMRIHKEEVKQALSKLGADNYELNEPELHKDADYLENQRSEELYDLARALEMSRMKSDEEYARQLQQEEVELAEQRNESATYRNEMVSMRASQVDVMYLQPVLALTIVSVSVWASIQYLDATLIFMASQTISPEAELLQPLEFVDESLENTSTCRM